MPEDPKHNERWQESVYERIEEQQKAVLIALRKNGIVAVACRAAGIGTTTFYRWFDNNAFFKHEAMDAMNEGSRNITDFARSGHAKNVMEGNPRSIIYELDHRDPAYQSKSMYEKEQLMKRDKDLERLAVMPELKEFFNDLKESGVLEALTSRGKELNTKMDLILDRLWPFIRDEGKIVNEEDEFETKV